MKYRILYKKIKKQRLFTAKKLINIGEETLLLCRGSQAWSTAQG